MWNKNEDRTYAPTTYSCEVDEIDPHTTTATFTDFDAVRVRSSGYYYARFLWVYPDGAGTSLTSYHKAYSNTWTRFPGTGIADCYSGEHVHCTITVDL